MFLIMVFLTHPKLSNVEHKGENGEKQAIRHREIRAIEANKRGAFHVEQSMHN